MKINREQFLAAAIVMATANAGCGKLANKFGVDKDPSVSDTAQVATPAPPDTTTPPLGGPSTPGNGIKGSVGSTAGGAKPIVLAANGQKTNGTGPAKEGFAPPSKEGVGPSREYPPPAREFPPPAREFPPPARELPPPAKEFPNPPNKKHPH